MPRLDADFHARPPTPVFRVDDSMGTYSRRVEALAEVRFQRTTRKPYRELLDYYARGATAFDPEYAAVIEFLVRRDALGALDTLAFVQPTRIG